MNGELRIGFFARRSIFKEEELTFDYQFQTFGEKRQKCYCGSDKCRGYLGISNSSSNNNLDHIWDDTDSDEDDDDDDDVENEDENSDNESLINLKKKKSRNYNKILDDLDVIFFCY